MNCECDEFTRRVHRRRHRCTRRLPPRSKKKLFFLFTRHCKAAGQAASQAGQQQDDEAQHGGANKKRAVLEILKRDYVEGTWSSKDEQFKEKITKGNQADIESELGTGYRGYLGLVL